MMWGVSRAYFETVTLSIVGFFLVVTVIFWVWGRRNIRLGLVGENDLLAAATAEAAPEAGLVDVGPVPAADAS